MQIVSSPSRDEIDKAHMFFYSVDVGIPSTRNFRFISLFKKSCWIILLLSSLPIHLFFNSTIFETTYLGSDWQATVATEAFTRGAGYSAPGASLAFNKPPEYWSPTTAYLNISGIPMLSKDTKKAAATGGNWTVMDPSTCFAEYTSCQPRNRYRDVVVVIDSGTNNKEGWVREEVFNLTEDLSLWWNTYISRNETNSLWYSTDCQTSRVHDTVENDCDHTCWDPLFPTGPNSYGIHETSPSNWTFFWNFSPHRREYDYGFNGNFSQMAVKYCLAEPQSRVCKVGISNVLLLLVIVCTIIKVIQCSIIVWKLPRQSLVTPGDAIASFITEPDPYTVGLGTLDVVDSCRLESAHRQLPSHYNEYTLDATIKPRRWPKIRRRYLLIIPRGVRLRTYVFLAMSIVLLAVCSGFSYRSNGNTFGGSFGHSDELRAIHSMDGAGYLTTLLVSNSPQLLLSACYFSYNAFLTRILVEQEWNSYSLKYNPLRVTYPEGDQISSYRLQLPYKYSIPLIIIMIICHWLLSNALFFFGIEGGFWGISVNASYTQAYFHLSENSLVSLGYSAAALLALLVVSCTIVPLPLLLSLRKPKGKMVAGGWDSLVISAACHCFVSSSTEVESQPHSPPGEVAEGAQYPEDSSSMLVTDDSGEPEEEALKKLSRSKLKWGATPLPRDLAEVMSEESGNPVMHLGFGGESSHVRCVEEGESYI
ncbi:uncharacterized protein F4812DRAFT_461410 [Daldinia caldariorum]|uniref:uncharacterized protein n=1 Tax=Daldinia caldariorum TaxID=326644 RepID=UPI002008317E|nr:uncharacterized protein F4812DRAFT_461410 [Daldinia caldariorum]KAI1465716.1 hypothetical protein F4812DRAFT_461410 [Daldinia caldariorum]